MKAHSPATKWKSSKTLSQTISQTLPGKWQLLKGEFETTLDMIKGLLGLPIHFLLSADVFLYTIVEPWLVLVFQSPFWVAPPIEVPPFQDKVA